MVHDALMNPLELSSVRQFQRNPDKTTSSYSFIPTTKVIEQLADSGWHVVAGNQTKVKDPMREGYQRHYLKLENPELNTLLPTIGKPQMLLKNSHEGSSSFQLLSAFKIFVCSNGAVSHSGDIGDVRVLHKGFSEELFQKAIQDFLIRIPKMVTQVEEWQSISLDKTDQLKLAQDFIEMRFDPITDSFGHSTGNYPIAAEHALHNRRWGEKSTNLWTAFNNIQENLLEKGLPNAGRRNANGRKIPIRAVKSLDANVRLNKQLWELTAAMADQKLGRLSYAI